MDLLCTLRKGSKYSLSSDNFLSTLSLREREGLEDSVSVSSLPLHGNLKSYVSAAFCPHAF